MVAATTHVPVGAPSRWLTALEVRAFSERLAMSATMPILGRLPRGDGHSVLVLPGFTADDRSTQPLRELLGRLGYEAHGWDLGTNVGPTTQILDGLRDLVDELLRSQRPISIVGWSLGGIYARELARHYLTGIRQIVTLGSPVQMIDGDHSASRRLWDSLRHLYDPMVARSAREMHRPPLPAPCTSIYTRTDGIVHWRTCLITDGSMSENVEVFGSHCGLGFNPAVAFALADRLAQPEGEWQPFRSPLWLRGLFPKPSKGPSLLDEAA